MKSPLSPEMLIGGRSVHSWTERGDQTMAAKKKAAKKKGGKKR